MSLHESTYFLNQNFCNKKTVEIVYYFCALYQHAKQQEEHSMGLYTCFLHKERLCAKKDVLLWCLICD